jgi:uncharacterized protein YjiS (DUF1127 family)
MSILTASESSAILMIVRGTEAPTASRAKLSPEARPGLLTMLRGVFKSAHEGWVDVWLRKAEREQLMALLAAEDHLLTDIGLSRHDIWGMIRELDTSRA